jgi:C4-dicarboxylate transporter
MGHHSRDRVTIDLRCLRERLQALATVRQMTAAALVRQTLMTLLDEDSGEGDTRRNVPAIPATAIDTPVVKVTLRLPASQARALARRARAADVSQGAYVAGLIDGAPPDPLPPDHAPAVAALLGSTDQLP